MEQKRESNSNSNPNPNLIWGVLLIGVGVVFLLDRMLPGVFGGLAWAALFGAGSLATYGYYTRNRQNWWVLIPAYVMAFIAAVILLSMPRFMPGEIIGAFVMLAIGFPFLYVYLRDREHWWALIPAYTMGAIAGLILLSGILDGTAIAAYIMFAIAAPFFAVYALNRQNWWALIPGGIMVGLGAIFLIASIAYLIPAVMVLAGVYLLFRQFRSQRDEKTAPVSVPVSGPAADRPKAGPETEQPVVEFTPIGVGPEADRPAE